MRKEEVLWFFTKHASVQLGDVVYFLHADDNYLTQKTVHGLTNPFDFINTKRIKLNQMFIFGLNN